MKFYPSTGFPPKLFREGLNLLDEEFADSVLKGILETKKKPIESLLYLFFHSTYNNTLVRLHYLIKSKENFTEEISMYPYTSMQPTDG